MPASAGPPPWFISGIGSMTGVFFAYFLEIFPYMTRMKSYVHPHLYNTIQSKVYGYFRFAILIVSMVPGIASVALFVKGVMTVQNVLVNLL